MTSPPTPPYTEATVELVADAVAQATLAPAIGGTRRHARLVLNALVKAGLLLPEGAETRTEYGVEHTYPGQEPIGLPAVNRWAAERAAAQSGGVATRRLVERTTWSTPWREAAERDEDSRTDMDEPSLPASTGAPIHGPTSSGGHVG